MSTFLYIWTYNIINFQIKPYVHEIDYENVIIFEFDLCTKLTNKNNFSPHQAQANYK